MSILKTTFFILFIVSLLFTNCKKEDNTKTIIVEGVINDKISNTPISGIQISIDAIKSPSGMGIINGGKREYIKSLITDNNGHYYTKLKVFDGAEKLEFKINESNVFAPSPNGYGSMSNDLNVSDLKFSQSNNIDFQLSPVTILRIEFKNISPQNNSDRFWCNIPDKPLGSENCGSIIPTEAQFWEGANVCGTYICETDAEKKILVYWTLNENGIFYERKDSIFTKRNKINVIKLEY